MWQDHHRDVEERQMMSTKNEGSFGLFLILAIVMHIDHFPTWLIAVVIIYGFLDSRFGAVIMATVMHLYDRLRGRQDAWMKATWIKDVSRKE
jgi:hypothetical protein